MILRLENKNELRLPADYGYRVSSAVYRLASADAEFSAFLHDCGYGRDGMLYKLFTFSPLKGRYRVEGRSIVFGGELGLEIRSVSERFCAAVMRSLTAEGVIELSGNSLRIAETRLRDSAPAVGEAVIGTVSPVVVNSSSRGKTVYFPPTDPCWEERINNTLRRKYTAAFGEPPPSGVGLILLSEPKKVVTRVKGIWVTGYHARLRLTAHPRVTAFLYDTGLGAKNSQGFGMFALRGGV